MGMMADRLEALAVRASSPDGQIGGVYNATDGTVVRFRAGAFDVYRENALGHQLGELATRLWAKYRHGRQQVVSEVSGCPIPTNEEIWDARDRRFRANLAETTIEGMSPGEHIYFHTIGMATWHVVIRDGTLTELNEEAFAAEFANGHQTLLNDYDNKLGELRVKHYGAEL